MTLFYNISVFVVLRGAVGCIVGKSGIGSFFAVTAAGGKDDADKDK